MGQKADELIALVKSWEADDVTRIDGYNILLHAVYSKDATSQKANEEMISETYVFHLNFLGGNSTDICSTRYFVPIMNHELILPCLITPKHPAYVSIRKIFRQIAALYHEEVPGYELALKGLFLQVIFSSFIIMGHMPY